MNLTKQQQKELMQVYEAYWDNYMRGDVEAMIPLLYNDYTQVGSAEGEVFSNKKDAVKFLYDTIDQVAGKLEMRNRVTKLEQHGNIILIHERCDLYALADGAWIFYSKFRASTLMEERKEGWKITHQHSSFPDTKTEDGQNIAIEKITAENLQLRDAVKRRTIELEQKNRDLEIETSLERVRAITLSIRKPGDLTGICKVLFSELRTLGVDEIRNTMINIFDDENGSFLNYDYSDNAGKTITTFFYNTHPVIEKQVKQARSSADAFSQAIYAGKDLEDWKEFRKKAGEADDPKADNIDALFYSFYSIGTGVIGISTYSAITEEKLNVLKRFRNVFDFAYRRYMDVAEAEAQAREATIEAALERTRTQSMMMQHSKELDDTLRVFHEQVLLLGIDSAFSFLWLPDEDKDRHIFWAAWAENNSTVFKSKAINYPLDRSKPATAQCLVDWKGNQPIVSYHVPPSGVENYFTAWQELIDGVEQLKPEYFSGGLYYIEAFMKYGCFGVMVTNDLTEEEKKILGRFAVEFERTYTRFLDLQKAEAQARESQIQLALERVRARTMAMQQSNELPEAANLLFQQVQTLGMPAWSAGYCIWDEDKKAITLWMSSEGVLQPPFKAPLTEDPSFIHFLEAYQRGETFSVEETGGEELVTHYKYMRTLPVVGEILDSIIDAGHPLPTFQIFHCAYFSKGFLLFITYEPVPEAHDIFKRFAKVFEQTYTRFLDLQKAEAQAREAQIEAALERVRSRSMGMQKSEELKEVIKIVYKQLTHLKIKLDHAGFVVDYTPKGDWHFWIADEQDIHSTITHPYFESVWANQFNEAKEKGADIFATHLNFEEKNKFYNELLSYVPGLPEASKDFYLNCPALAASTVLFDNVSLYIENFSGTPYTDEENTTLKRFGKVFQQTYTRFLDLQKAEAQAREAQIEAALERVRSRSMAMHKSEELADLSLELVKQVQALGVTTWFCAFNIYDNHPLGSLEWGSNGQGTFPRYRTPREGIFLRYYEAGQRGEMLIINEIGEKECAAHYEYLCSLPGVGEQLLKMKKAGIPFPAFQIDHVAFFKYGYVLFITYEEVPESHDIFRRFAKVFEQTYTRFLDLQKAEAQAKEAQIETALERVRGRTLAMQKSGELAETAAVLFQQLIALGIEPNRLYIAIVKDETGESEFWITEEDGTKISTAFSADLNKNASFAKMFEGWKQQRKSLVIDMQGDELQNYFRHLTSLGVPFKGGLSQQRRVQDIAYFSKGFIGIASPAEQPAETLVLLERFAAVFNLTFTRFNDLKIAEAHALQAEQDLIAIKESRKKAEEALTELQVTQKQLIQSEKMASLGELTAGIAHEIQNPLNFVNNFSEVSNELIEEMNEELNKGDIEEAKAIANDIQQNLEKINHHGKRADAIVKGMLQHSRTSNAVKEPTDINKLADEYLRLAYHGLRAKDKSFNTTLNTNFDETIGNINIIPQDIGRVLLNLYNNAFYAVNERTLSTVATQTAVKYEPTISITTKKIADKVTITVSDNGNGIPQKVVDKIFQPFFTTKPTGQGTGLGLSLSYDIIKAHGGEIKVETKDGGGSEFIIQLPII